MRRVLSLSLLLIFQTLSRCNAADSLLHDVSEIPVREAMEKDRLDWMEKLTGRDFATLE